VAKWWAGRMFRDGLPVAERVFRNHALRKYRCRRRNVAFDTKGALRRIRHAVVGDDRVMEGVLGCTDGITIWIMEEAQTHSEIVSTLIHEACHNWCHVRGRPLSCRSEHICMMRVGERAAVCC